MIEKGRCLPPEKPSGRPAWQARGWPFVQAADAKGGSTWAADTVKVAAAGTKGACCAPRHNR